MPQFDVEPLIAPLDGEGSSGPNLEYDPEFLALERAAAPKAERAVGDSVKAAEEPDWENVAELATTLLGRTKDLRVAMHLATAWLQLGSFPGFSAGLGLIQKLTENLWDGVHPQLDAEDDNDPTTRVNSVAPLGDPMGTLRYLRIQPFVASQRLGRFSLRDLRIANGTLKPAAVSANDDAPAPPAPPTLAMLEGACRDCPEQLLADNTTAISAAFETAKAINQVFTDKLGAAGPDLKNLVSDLFELKKFTDAQLARRKPAAAAAAGDDDEEAGTEGSSSGRGGGGPGGRISSAEDVINRIDELCDYYAKTEPSSPVPLLLRRAQRLVGKNFLDLLKDLAPVGVAQLTVVAGVDSAGSGSVANNDDE